MRDALSLTDQAIAYSAGNLTEEAVRGMLGTIDQRHLVRLLDALSTGDAKGVLAVADELAIRGLSYAGALADLAVLLSRVAIEQRVTGVTPAEDPLAADIARLAQSLHPDAAQLFYSVAVHSRGELTLAPDEYAGFIMACLRMLALNGEAGPRDRAGKRPAAPARRAASPVCRGAERADSGRRRRLPWRRPLRRPWPRRPRRSPQPPRPRWRRAPAATAAPVASEAGSRRTRSRQRPSRRPSRAAIEPQPEPQPAQSIRSPARRRLQRCRPGKRCRTDRPPRPRPPDDRPDPAALAGHARRGSRGRGARVRARSGCRRRSAFLGRRGNSLRRRRRFRAGQRFYGRSGRR